jgi:predicted secreted protein
VSVGVRCQVSGVRDKIKVSGVRFQVSDDRRPKAEDRRQRAGVNRCQVSGVSAAAGLKSGKSNLKRNFVLGWFHMTG